MHDKKDDHDHHDASVIAAAQLKALGEMAGGIAHEINTPLTVIRMTVDGLEERVREGSVDETELFRAFAMINKTVDRISKIITGLRQFTGNRENLPITKVTVSSLIESSLTFCGERFKNHSVKLQYDKTSCEKVDELECRNVEISQVILNLLLNSHDAVQNLPEKWVRIEAADKGEMIEIYVTDSGKGIPKAQQKRLMQPFYTTKDVGQGMGLGLSIAKGIVESHEGKLFLDVKNEHTRFVVQLPKKQKPHSVAA